ncbi:MAG: hypothetical protein HYZ54_08105 [Ignavibacteriae bacterium]|nr:hypothetical protein [Ignavibacteriota bacterium]
MSIFRNYRIHLVVVCTFTFLLRGLYWFVSVDHINENYWEYGEISHNLYEGKGYSYWSKENGSLISRYSISAQPQPSAYMMPGYTYYLYPFWGIYNATLRSFLILGIGGWLCSLLVVWLLFQWSGKWLSTRVGLAAAWLYALTPEFIVAANTYSATIFIHVCVLTICLLLQRKQLSNVSLILMAVCCAVYVSMRPEAVIFIGMLIVYAFSSKQYRITFAASIGILCVIVPWTIRNYYVFDEFTPLTTSSGQNFYRGHNPYGLGVWMDDAMHDSINTLPFTPKLEIEMNSFFKQEAWRAIQANPLRESWLTIVKAIQLWSINPSDQRSLHPMYYTPWAIIFICCTIGFYRLRLRRSSIPLSLVLYLCSCTVTAMIFFTLPRYQTMMKIVLLPIAAVSVIWIKDRLYLKYGKN